MAKTLTRAGAALVTLLIIAGCGGSPTLTPPAAPAAAINHPTSPASGALGHDVGNISCQAELPSGGSFGVVGATGGQPFSASPCLSAEYAWATAFPDKPEFYINLANPGHKSKHWGHGGPKACHRKTKYDVGCAFDYGYETAASAWQYVKAVGSAGQGHWWLDVEPDNSWGTSSPGIAANIADIRGALKYVRSRPKTVVGIYTETTWWSTITHSSTKFSGVPVWGGGANTKGHARANCRHHSITGGPALLAQWIVGGVDHDVAC